MGKNARATAAAAMTALGGGQNVVADVTDLAVDPIAEYAGFICTDEAAEAYGGDQSGSTIQVCDGGDDSESWQCATSEWLSDLAPTRADSIFAAFGQLPTINGLPGT